MIRRRRVVQVRRDDHHDLLCFDLAEQILLKLLRPVPECTLLLELKALGDDPARVRLVVTRKSPRPMLGLTSRDGNSQHREPRQHVPLLARSPASAMCVDMHHPGMGVMISRGLPGAAVARRVVTDDEGKFLGVQLNVYGRETLILACHASNGKFMSEGEGEQEAYFGRLTQALRGLPQGSFDDVVCLGDWNNVEDMHVDYSTAGGVSAQHQSNPNSAGVAAMHTALSAVSALMRRPSAMVDSYRSMYQGRREYTRWHGEAGAFSHVLA